jgi:hypothetical protein
MKKDDLHEIAYNYNIKAQWEKSEAITKKKSELYYNVKDFLEYLNSETLKAAQKGEYSKDIFFDNFLNIKTNIELCALAEIIEEEGYVCNIEDTLNRYNKLSIEPITINYLHVEW